MVVTPEVPEPFVIEPSETYRLPLVSVMLVTVIPGSWVTNRTTFTRADTDAVQERVCVPEFLSH